MAEMKVTKATPKGFVVGIEGDTGRMAPQEFVAAVNNAVKTFLADSKGSPKRESILDSPELAAAAREGFEGNGPAKAYALGCAAGQKEGAQARAAQVAGLKEWIEARRVGFATGFLGPDDILAEIDQRLGGPVR